MPFRRFIVRLAAGLGALLLVSCIDGSEEYWLNADGSGSAEITYSLPAAAATFQGGQAGVEKLLANFLKNTPAITSSSHQVTVRKQRITVAVKFTFDSVVELRNISLGGSKEKLPPAADNLIGTIDLKLVGRHVSAVRTLNVAKALPGSSFLPSSQFTGHQLRYIVHLPVAATVSNATRTADRGRTLIWDFPLAAAVRAPQIIRFQAPIPIPVKWLIAATSGMAALVMATVAIIRKWRRHPKRRQGNPAGIQTT